jgi:hypothetical protein
VTADVVSADFNKFGVKMAKSKKSRSSYMVQRRCSSIESDGEDKSGRFQDLEGSKENAGGNGSKGFDASGIAGYTRLKQ